MRDQRGFTLIEMLVVVLLIALISAFAVPSVSSYFQISLNSASRDLGSVVKEAYNSTVLTGRVYRLAYDLKNNQFWVEAGPTNVLLDTEDSKKKEEYDKLHNTKEAVEESSFAIDKTITRRKTDLPRGVTYDDIMTMQSKEPIKTGMAYTHFFPHGMTEQTIIHLIDGSGHKSSLIISPLIGRTDVYDRYISLEEAFGKK